MNKIRIRFNGVKLALTLLGTLVTVGAYAAAVKSFGPIVQTEVDGVAVKQRVVFCSSAGRRKIQRISGQRNWCVVNAGAEEYCSGDKVRVAKRACAMNGDESVAGVDASSVALGSGAEAPEIQAAAAMDTTADIERVSALKSELEQIEVSVVEIQQKMEKIDAERAELLKRKKAFERDI